jgi:NAD-dependent SIR2 family protein deacetylase
MGVSESNAGKYEPRGGLQLVRHAELREFTCSRCGGRKKSKLVAHQVREPEKPLCNGCYGLLLSKSR